MPQGPTSVSEHRSAIDELFEDGSPIDAALREAARDARRLHKALGNPMAAWKDRQVVWIQPDDINIDTDPDTDEAREGDPQGGVSG